MDHDDQEDVREARATSLHESSRSHVRMPLVQAPVDAEGTAYALPAGGSRTSDAGIAPPATTRLHVHRDIAELRQDLTRRLAKREDRGGTAPPGTQADLPLLAELLAPTGQQEDSRSPHPEYLTSMHAGRAATVASLRALGGAS